MTFSAYPEYKSSGIDWLEQVPNHWEIKPLWTMFHRIKRTNSVTEELLSVYRDHGVIPKSSRDDNNNRASEDLEPYQLVNVGDLVVNKMKAWQGSVAISKYRGIVSPAYFVYEATHDQHPQYLHYLMRSDRYITAYLSMSKGIRVNQWDLEAQYHSRLPLLVPPKNEQQKISNFLDYETTKIDSLVAEQTRLIELLKEKCQVVISNAVTKGLRSNVKMKESGVEWLGEVPEHWEIKKMKHIATASNGLTYAPENLVDSDEGTLVLRSSNIQNGKISLNDNVYVKIDIPQKSKVASGDILICSRNGSRALIGKNALIPDELDGVAYGAFMMLLKSPISKYIYWILNSFIFKFQSSLFLTSTINQLTVADLYGFELPIPPLEEQQEISQYLSEKQTQFNQLIDKATKVIDLLKERQSALITEAVIGQIDLRQAAIEMEAT